MQSSTVEKFKKKRKLKESNTVRQNKNERKHRDIKRAMKDGEYYQED
jgi:hypothetical protein